MKKTVVALLASLLLCGPAVSQKKDAPKEKTVAADTANPPVAPKVQMPPQTFQSGVAELNALSDVISREKAALEVLTERYNSLRQQLTSQIPKGYQYQNGVFTEIEPAIAQQKTPPPKK